MELFIDAVRQFKLALEFENINLYIKGKHTCFLETLLALGTGIFFPKQTSLALIISEKAKHAFRQNLSMPFVDSLLRQLFPSKSKSVAHSHPEDAALITQELVDSKLSAKEYKGILASRLPTGGIIPSRGRGRRGRGGGWMHNGTPCRMSLTVGWPSRQGSLPLSFVSVQKLYM